MKAIRIATLFLLGTTPFAFSGNHKVSANMLPSKPAAPLGDGSIPIGRVRGLNVRNISVRVTTARESYVVSPNFYGEINVPCTATPGRWQINAQADSAFPVNFYVNVADQQSSFFDIWMLPSSRAGDVTRAHIRTQTDPVVLRVGQWYWFNTDLQGPNPFWLFSSYWLDGNVGLLYSGGMFVATKPGDAVLFSETLGVRTSVRLKVIPGFSNNEDGGPNGVQKRIGNNPKL